MFRRKIHQLGLGDHSVLRGILSCLCKAGLSKRTHAYPHLCTLTYTHTHHHPWSPPASLTLTALWGEKEERGMKDGFWLSAVIHSFHQHRFIKHLLCHARNRLAARDRQVKKPVFASEELSTYQEGQSGKLVITTPNHQVEKSSEHRYYGNSGWRRQRCSPRRWALACAGRTRVVG